MVNYQSNRQLSLSNFLLPFSGELKADNRWIKWANIIPWDNLANIYGKSFSDDLGRGSKDLRIEIGTLIIQELTGYTDREVISQIQENPYLQYFLGFQEFTNKIVFDPSLLVTIRKRLNQETIAEFTEQVAICHKRTEKKSSKSKKPKDDSSKGKGDKKPKVSAEEKEPENDGKPIKHNGELIVDATAAELQIPYPTDLGLLNEARLQSEKIIDLLWSLSSCKGNKPRTYRQNARTAYLVLSKKRRKSKKDIRKGIKQQLQYLRRNIKVIKKLLSVVSLATLKIALTRRDRTLINTIKLVYEQQLKMHKEKIRRIDHRIVNLYQPWVRPIIRGKSGKNVEFGPKLSVSLVDGITYVDKFSWEAFNESTHLQDQVEKYYKRNGFYPETVIGDMIYGNRKNRQYLKSLGICYSGKALGRPVQITPENKKELATQKKRRKAEQCRRNRIEGCFGVGRRRYSLGQVRTRLKETSEAKICMAFFAITFFVLKQKLSQSFQIPFNRVYQRIFSQFYRKYINCDLLGIAI